MLIHVSEQLRLELRMPWNGQNPRALTRGAKRFSLLRMGTPRPDRGCALAVQLELFPEGTSYGT